MSTAAGKQVAAPTTAIATGTRGQGSLRAGIDIIIGHPNLCSLKGWTKVPHRSGRSVGPPTAAEAKPAGAAPPKPATTGAGGGLPPDPRKNWKVQFQARLHRRDLSRGKGKLFFKFSTRWPN
ncbi:MAG: hypothetical protein R2882_01450 [Gemmatimonadales bacterium]